MESLTEKQNADEYQNVAKICEQDESDRASNVRMGIELTPPASPEARKIRVKTIPASNNLSNYEPKRKSGPRTNQARSLSHAETQRKAGPNNTKVAKRARPTSELSHHNNPLPAISKSAVSSSEIISKEKRFSKSQGVRFKPDEQRRKRESDQSKIKKKKEVEHRGPSKGDTKSAPSRKSRSSSRNKEVDSVNKKDEKSQSRSLHKSLSQRSAAAMSAHDEKVLRRARNHHKQNETDQDQVLELQNQLNEMAVKHAEEMYWMRLELDTIRKSKDAVEDRIAELYRDVEEVIGKGKADQRQQQLEHPAYVVKIGKENNKDSVIDDNLIAEKVGDPSDLMISVKPEYITTLQNQIDKYDRVLRIMKHQADLVKKSSDEEFASLKDELSDLVFEKSRGEMELMNKLNEVHREKRETTDELAHLKQKLEKEKELRESNRELLQLEYDLKLANAENNKLREQLQNVSLRKANAQDIVNKEEDDSSNNIVYDDEMEMKVQQRLQIELLHATNQKLTESLRHARKHAQKNLSKWHRERTAFQDYITQLSNGASAGVPLPSGLMDKNRMISEQHGENGSEENQASMLDNHAASAIENWRNLEGADVDDDDDCSSNASHASNNNDEDLLMRKQQRHQIRLLYSANVQLTESLRQASQIAQTNSLKWSQDKTVLNEQINQLQNEILDVRSTLVTIERVEMLREEKERTLAALDRVALLSWHADEAMNDLDNIIKEIRNKKVNQSHKEDNGSTSATASTTVASSHEDGNQDHSPCSEKNECRDIDRGLSVLESASLVHRQVKMSLFSIELKLRSDLAIIENREYSKCQEEAIIKTPSCIDQQQQILNDAMDSIRAVQEKLDRDIENLCVHSKEETEHVKKAMAMKVSDLKKLISKQASLEEEILQLKQQSDSGSSSAEYGEHQTTKERTHKSSLEMIVSQKALETLQNEVLVVVQRVKEQNQTIARLNSELEEHRIRERTLTAELRRHINDQLARQTQEQEQRYYDNVGDDYPESENEFSENDEVSYYDDEEYDEELSYDSAQYEEQTIYEGNTGYDERTVYGEKTVYDDRTTYDERTVYDDRSIYDEQTICDDQSVYDEQTVYDDKPVRKGKDFSREYIEEVVDENEFSEEIVDNESLFEESIIFGDNHTVC